MTTPFAELSPSDGEEPPFVCEQCGKRAVDQTTGTCGACHATAMDSICCNGGYNCRDCPRERKTARSRTAKAPRVHL
jgi:hypothetical protein